MELAAAQLFLTPIVKLAISKVISNAEKQYGFMSDYEEELTKLLRTMEMTTGVLHDAEHRKAACHPGVKVWLQELRGVVEEADAVVDEISYEALKRKAVRKQKLKQVSHLFTSSNPLAFRRRMTSKINKLNDALDDLNKRASGLGLQYMLANLMIADDQGSTQQTDSSLGDPSEVIGREGDSEELVRLLLEPSNDQPLGVVSIVGVGGLGKTTLAKLVWEKEQIEKHFFKKIWVCVSEKFEVRSILVQMLESLTKEASSSSFTNQDAIVSKIKDMLQDKNYLLVLDDVWSEDEEKWKSLRNCLLGITRNVKSSKVLVTTRLPTSASMMESVLGKIELLKDDDCWSIIKHRAFRNSLVPLELEEIGRKIASKCRGVPLVANVVGGALGKNKNEDRWLSIEKDFDACGPLVDNDRVLQVLKLSFDRLPGSALKQCFAFCSTFPKDFVMKKEMLVQVWMANGFLQQPHGSRKEMEDIGEEYLTELVSYSFFQDVEKDLYGGIVSCKMHDLMHDLATSISKFETLVLEDSGTSDFYDIRHLNLICSPSMGPTKTMRVIEELHSLFSKVDVFKNTGAEFKRLLVLSFRGADISELPSILGDLKRLRYLDVSWTKIKEFPKSISKLYLLQTLRFTGCEFMKRPIKGIENLSNLKHIHFYDEELMPAGVGSLTCLQTLPLFVVKHQEGYRIEELGQLNQLKGDLKILNLGHVSNKAEAVTAKLCEKTAIRSLDLEFKSMEAGDHDADDVLEGLKPHSNLKGLALRGYRAKSVPGWMFESTGNLTRMEFSNCGCLESIPSLLLRKLMKMNITSCDGLESIESLSLNNSGKLTISSCDSLKSVAVSSLKSLRISGCRELVSVHVGPVAIASLKRISIQYCEKLETLPIISELPLLKELHIRNCKKLSCIGDSSTSFASTCLAKLDIYECPNLASIPGLKDEVSRLQSLSISHHQQLKSIIKWESFPSSTCLKQLTVDNCDRMMYLPSLSEFSSLHDVSIWECQQLKSIEGESLPSCLRRLSIRHCGVLTSISLLGGFSTSSCCLEKMSVSSCAALVSIKPPRVEMLKIQYCRALVSLCLDRFSSSSACLKELSVEGCPALTSFPNLHGFTSLQQLCVEYCGLRRLPDGLESLLHLSKLELGPFSEDLEEFPDLSPIDNSLKKLTLTGWDKLKHLHIWGFNKLEALPDWLGNLSSLRKLGVLDCKSLMYEPSIEAIQSLSNLESLYIRYCPKFEERYAVIRGTKLDKLSHISLRR